MIDCQFWRFISKQYFDLDLDLNKANASDTEALFLDLHSSIFNDLFLPNFTINVSILILKLSISRY